jgi:uridine monophosphate synthetase
MVVVNREQGGKETLEKAGYRVHALAKISDIVASLCKDNRISKEQAEKVLEFVESFKK